MKNKIFWIFLILIVFRIAFGFIVGVNINSNAGYDDVLLLRYVNIVDHFKNPSMFSLLKYLGYPVFLALVFVLQIPYTIILSGLWSIAAISVFFCFKKLGYRKIAIFGFIYTLFFPTAFEAGIGVRVYRNSIFIPFFIIFSYIIIQQIYYINSDKQILKTTILLSLIFPFIYYIKEDSIWLLLSYCFVVAIEVFILIKKYLKRVIHKKLLVKKILYILLPVLSFVLITFCYKLVNYKYFGVFETQTRTEGELGNFCKNIYKIDSKNRTADEWAPYDAIDRAFKVSKTLKSMPKLKEKLVNSSWQEESIKEKPIRGDFLTWYLRTALDESGIWKNEKQVSNLFEKVNRELKEAFDKGIIKKDNRVQIVSSAGGRTKKEILDLRHLIFASYNQTILLDEYVPGCSVQPSDNTVNMEAIKYAEKIIHTHFNFEQDDNIVDVYFVNKIINILFTIYKIINIFLLIILGFSFFITIINIKKYKSFKNECFVFAILCFLGIGFVYTFGICWFSSFLCFNSMAPLVFYNLALPVCMMFSYLFGLCVVFKFKKNTI